MKPQYKPKTCIFCENEIQEMWKSCPNCGFDLAAWNTFEKNVEIYRDFVIELNFDLAILRETLKTNITNPITTIIKIFEAIKKLEESKIEIDDPILKSKYILLKNIRNNQCAHNEKDFKDIKMVGVAFDVLDFLLQECYGVISGYNKQISVFVPSNNWDKILEKISATNLVVLSGDPFSGKTTTLYNIARFFSDKGYKIENNMENIGELFDFRKESIKPKPMSEKWNQKYVFILDDIFGDTQFDPSLGNYWSRKIITILNNSQRAAKFLIATRKDILEEFLKTNAELQIHGKLDGLINCIFELGITSYTTNDLKEILKTNADFIKLEAPKMAILLKETDMITQKRNLPGDIFNFLEEIKNSDNFDKNSLNKIFTENNTGVNVYANRIKRLENYEKIFLYNLYITQNFVKDDLEAIYSLCLPSDMQDRNYFVKCVTKFEDYFIKTKTQNDWWNQYDFGKKKFEFAHPIYREAIEKLINSDKYECCNFEDVIDKIIDLVHHQNITGWKSIDPKYDQLKFNIYQIILTQYIYLENHLKDFIIEMLNEMDFKKALPSWSYCLELSLDKISFIYGEVDYLEKLFYNYDKFDIILKGKFIYLLKTIDNYEVVAYCFAYMLDTETVIKFQDKLKNLSKGNEEVKNLVAKCIIRNYDFLNEDNKKLLYNLEVKNTLLMQFLMHNYNIISKDLREALEKQIALIDKKELIETCKTFLLNYSFLPEKIRRYYDFIFDLSDEIVFKQVGEAFEEWFKLALIERWHDPKRERLDEKVLGLYCNWLKNDKIISTNYIELLEMIYGDGSTLGLLPESIHWVNFFDDSNLFSLNPKWIDPSLSKLKDAFTTNMIILLNSLNSSADKAIIYGAAFDCYIWSGNIELIRKIANVINDSDDVKLAFLEGCFSVRAYEDIDYKYPYKITVSQIDIIKKLSEARNNLRVRSIANEVLDYIKTSIDNHSMEIIQDDFS